MIHGHGDDAYQYDDIRMDFSSNIYSHADLSALKEHLRRHLDLIGHYPEPEAATLEREIARARGVPAACVIVTNGATDAIYLIAQWLGLGLPLPSSEGEGTLMEARGRMRFAVRRPTFCEYADACRMYGLEEEVFGSKDDMRLEEKDAGAKESRLHTALWLCNPNNPTGDVLPPDDVLRLATAYGWLILDQSYEDYTDAPLLSPAEAIRHGRIIQLFSMTKTYAVPGLRIGYIIAAPSIAATLRRYLRPWSVNALAIESGRWLISHDQKAFTDKERYLHEAQRLREALVSIRGIEVQPTSTNFMLCRIAQSASAELKAHLAEKHHILIRDASNFEGLDPHYFRVAAQTPEENDKLAAAIGEWMA